jgi:hypothetical protein
METDPLKDVCNILNFEKETWKISDQGNASTLSWDLLDETEDEYLMKVEMNSDTEAIVESKNPIKMEFKPETSDITVSVGFRSTAQPFEEWGVEVSLLLKGEEDTSYQNIETIIYDPEDPEEGAFKVLTFTLPEAYALQVAQDKPVFVAFRVNALQPEVEFNMIILRFCDNADNCNPYCAEDLSATGHLPPPESMPEIFTFEWDDEASDMVPNQDSLSGSIINTGGTDYYIEFWLVATTALGQKEEIQIGQMYVEDGQQHEFSIPSYTLPFNSPGFIGVAHTKVIYTQPGEVVLPSYTAFSSPRYYHHNTDGTISHFNKNTFVNGFDALLFKQPEDIPFLVEIKDEDKNVIEAILSEGFGSAEYDPSLWENDTDSEQDTDIDTDIIIVIQ